MIIVRVLLLVFLMLVSSCASNAKKSPENVIARNSSDKLKVEVFTNGRKIEQVESELVHRIALSRDDVHLATANNASSSPFGLRTELEKDASGARVGFRITALLSRRTNCDLGLKVGDIVTAVGATTRPKHMDIIKLFTMLESTGSASITLVRAGMNHKILYYIK